MGDVSQIKCYVSLSGVQSECLGKSNDQGKHMCFLQACDHFKMQTRQNLKSTGTEENGVLNVER